MSEPRTLAQSAGQPAPRSFGRRKIGDRARPLSVHEYLIDEANLRGYWGAFRAGPVVRAPDPGLELEDVVVGLLAPQAPAEARIFKLVLRILQSGKLEARKLILRAKRERSEGVLYWLLQQVPEVERNPPVQALLAQWPSPPRGFRPLDYRYDPQRLVRRPARREDLWRRLRRPS